MNRLSKGDFVQLAYESDCILSGSHVNAGSGHSLLAVPRRDRLSACSPNCQRGRTSKPACNFARRCLLTAYA